MDAYINGQEIIVSQTLMLEGMVCPIVVKAKVAHSKEEFTVEVKLGSKGIPAHDEGKGELMAHVEACILEAIRQAGKSLDKNPQLDLFADGYEDSVDKLRKMVSYGEVEIKAVKG